MIVIILIGVLIFLFYILGSSCETFTSETKNLKLVEETDKEKIAFMDSLKETEKYCNENSTVECKQFMDGLGKLREGINVMLKKHYPSGKAEDFF